ncbi:hypothetical protein AU184_03765 [Mycolicibacterium novocastrense]|uniref:hypothetical protein n=1 Tax=Mycolicibacterium novocastrense TaxID=59813 RepID=UPI000747C1E7|nr:hypothetical protein [Mycolicibacterium novocastrense]KUH70775.1 hypothetical protein AU183_18095 [Mycolicibacterium novocastrense]KUH71754.1 hypothetical protein AU072_11080 [Mycolicibacterium novocastrense]KUH72101.1 hypothetical protein AU184_03765 [Mycolicibacterium novocastrense]
MALDTPLNTRQLDVLQWIGDRCPEGRWTDFNFKATAAALQNRRLVTVTKRGGWQAKIEPAGVYYLKHGDYPADHFPNKRRSYSRTMRLMHSEHGKPQRPLTRPGPDEPTPTRKLLQDIIEAGGVLEFNTRDDDINYASLVAIINRRQMAPDGQQVILMDGVDYYHKVLRLSSVAEWKTQPPAEVVAAERIGRWHPAVAALRSENRLSSIEPSQRQRALRLLHSLAREAEARGYTVQESPKREPRGYGYHDREQLPGCMIVGVAPIKCSVGMAQLKDKVPHEATIKELERAKRESWYRIPTHDSVPSERLSITLNTDSRYSSGVSWSDTKTIPLESRLPDIMTLFERWTLIHTERTEAEHLAEIEKQKRIERENELARQAYVQHAQGEQLIANLKDWELVGRLGHYLADMADRVEHIIDDDERTAAVEWLEWCKQYMAKRDPFSRPIKTPKVKQPDYSDIDKFRRRIGTGSWW